MYQDVLNGITESNVVYRCIGGDFSNGILSCGYMAKKDVSKSQYNFVINYYSCFVLLRGSGIYSDAAGNRIPIHPGDLVQRLPQVVHSTEIVPDGQWLEFYISFGYQTFKYLRDLGLIHDERPVLHTVVTRNDLDAFGRLLRDLKAVADDELPELLFRAQQMVYRLQKENRPKDLPAQEIVTRAKEMLGQNLESDLSAAAVARQLNIGYESFRKIFKAETGVAPAAYRTQRRMAHAQLLLMAGLGISEIAALVGYGDCYAFSKQFKRTLGLSPRSYRKTLAP